MAYHCTLEGKILTLVSVEHSFHRTKRSYWYYDIENWLTSITGREGEEPTVPMVEGQIEWVKKHYLPKVAAS